MNLFFRRTGITLSMTTLGLIVPQLSQATMATYSDGDAQAITALLIFVAAAGVTAMVIGFLWTIFWIWMLVDAIQHVSQDKRLMWVLLLVFLHYFAAVVYYLMEYRPRQQLARTAAASPTPTNTTAGQS
jgi:succinate dehydrogenase/fumarate reductase cytochrome b subunit